MTAKLEAAEETIRALTVLLRQRQDGIKALREEVTELQSENARLRTEHRAALEAERTEYRQLASAYEQFQQHSDRLLEEREAQNAHLQAEKARIEDRLRSALADAGSQILPGWIPARLLALEF